MKNWKAFIFIGATFILYSCQNENGVSKKKWYKINYKNIVNLIKKDNSISVSDTSNLFDKNEYDPASDSIEKYLNEIQLSYEIDSFVIQKMGKDSAGILANSHTDSLTSIVKIDTTSAEITKIHSTEISALKFNLEQLRTKDSLKTSTANCKQIQCRCWAKISKINQKLYLHLDGNLVDSFLVSTGDKKHETPLLDMRPSGPIFQKYTSKKYPGGNYNGLGNMPYVVFVKGGYGIHGTTKGNIPKLGKKASHGCVRLHPDNAKIFNEVVRLVGIENTWITIVEE